jgi:hypothetical protein
MKKDPNGECDFCSSPDVRYAYPARDFIIKTPSEIPDWGSAGGWAACPPCHALIQRGDRDRLARRSAKRMAKTYDISLRAALAAVRRAQDDFWANREGAPEPIELT